MEESCREKISRLKACVLIPTYNNAGTLASVINGVLKFTESIIVINDGSTDDTAGILQQFNIDALTVEKNTGKGNALRTGFKHAMASGYVYAITIDSDGQHFPEDIPRFIDKLEVCGDAIIIGARDMEQSGIPGKSSFGHKFSNFWFKVETGINAPDTQSGFRLYPLQLLKLIKFHTVKFEFEIEVIVRAAWRDIKIESVPVTIYYEPGGSRVTHFRPFKDFTRISILNTILVIIAFIYIKPRDFIRKFSKRKNLRQALRQNLLNSNESALRKSLSIAFGVFMGIVPIWGFQMLVAITLAIFLKLNKALVIIAANISIPPMIPLIVYLSYKTGELILPQSEHHQYDSSISLQSIGEHAAQYIYGSIVFAVVAALTSGIISYIILKLSAEARTKQHS
jgi:glycosyltransferase involved in cell wall biosynthesis